MPPQSTMSDIFTETVPRAESVEAPPQTRASSRWIKRIILLVVLLAVASEGISLAMQHTGLRNLLTERLQSAFGRPVEVGSYDFSLLNGVALEANTVTVGEDPHFGQEYFLRADSIAVRLRWLSLLRGRIEFGTLSLYKPSLNLVRNATGDWNLTQWLPQPGPHPALRLPFGPAFPSSPLRFRRIEVNGGRINFKNGDEKLPFAFIGVKGTVETDPPGRWRMNLDATPWRAAVIMQQAGTIRLSGDLGGTSSRLRPAALDISWSDASISDVLRLASGNDNGMRGALALQINARTDDSGDGWTVKASTQLQQIHRWDLALRPDNPSVDVVADVAWSPSAPFIEITQATLDAPHSHAQASGRLYWRPEVQPFARSIPPVQVVYADADIDMRDLLAWVRGFRPGVTETLDARGFARAHAALAGWPPRIIGATVLSSGVDLAAPSLLHPAHLGEIRLRDDRGVISLPSVALNFRAPDDAVRFEIAAQPGRDASNYLRVSANVSDVHDVLATAAAWGWNPARGWDISGPVRAELRWQGTGYRWLSTPVGFINWGAGPGVATLRVPFLNQPIGGINAVSEWKPGSRHVAVASAEAFGAHWSGTFDRVDSSASSWQFSLAADRLAVANLDRWLNPAWREGFLDRMLPFLNSRPSAAAAPENLRAAGRLTLDQLTLAPFVVRKLQGDLRIEGRHVVLANASAQFYGGQLAGTLDANLFAAPVYRADLDFSRVDAASLAAATPLLAGLTADSAEGQISMVASGANRADLLASLTCQGNAQATGAELLGIDLWKQPNAELSATAPTKFGSASAAFSCAQRKIDFQSLSLQTSPGTSAVGFGTIDFSRNLDLHFQTRSVALHDEDTPAGSFRLTGTLASPRVVSTLAAPRRSR
jgi:AsmA-like C-terminal region